jgi:4-aminobutyrate aminotransferase
MAEPMRWTTVEPAPADFWPMVRASCDRYGALLIFDEIPSCLGCTGTMFLCEHAGCVPDILVLSKGLGGGVLPMAALIAKPELDVAADGALGLYSHDQSPVGCTAALATLQVIEEEGLLAVAVELGRHARGRLGLMARRYPWIGDVRGIGFC